MPTSLYTMSNLCKQYCKEWAMSVSFSRYFYRKQKWIFLCFLANSCRIQGDICKVSSLQLAQWFSAWSLVNGYTFKPTNSTFFLSTHFFCCCFCIPWQWGLSTLKSKESYDNFIITKLFKGDILCKLQKNNIYGSSWFLEEWL